MRSWVMTMGRSRELIGVAAIAIAIAARAGIASAQKAEEKAQTAKVTLTVQGMT